MSTASHAEGDLPDHVLDDELESFQSGSIPALTADDLILDYVKSRLANPHKSLASAAARSSFISSLLGDSSLATEALDDASLLRQLESRVVVLVNYIAAAIPSADEFVTDAFVAVLVHIAARWSILLEAMEREGVSVIVIRTMRRFGHHAAIAARCLTALRAFAVTDSMRKRVIFDGGVDVALDIMSIHQNDHRVQDRAAAVIANVAFGCPHRKRRIARQGGIKKIVDGMCAFPDDENIQLRGALTIRNLTYEAQVNQYIAGNQGAVEAVGAALLRFRGNSANPELRFQCVMALDSLCREDERNRQRIIDMDSAMLSGPQSSSSISPVISRHSDDADKEHVNEDGDVIVDEEEVLLSDVNTTLGYGIILCPGRPLAVLDGPPSLATSGESEEPVLIVTEGNSSAQHAKEHTHVTTEGSGIDKQANRRENPSLIRAIIHAVCRDPDDQLLLETGLSLLTLISVHRPAVQIRLGELKGPQVAIAAIRRYPKSEAVVARGCALLRCLCMRKVNRGRITSGLLALISAARDHSQNPSVTREVIAALGNAVFKHEKNKAWVTNNGGIAAIARTIHDSGESDIMVLEAAVCALRNFVDANCNGALAAAKEGVIRAAVFALDRTKSASSAGERAVQEQAVKLLADIACLAPQAKEEMRQIDADDWVENALAKLSVDQYPELHGAGDDLIASLSRNYNNEGEKRRSVKNRGYEEPERSATGSNRLFGGILSSLFAIRWKKAGEKPDVRKRLPGHSMPIERETRRSRRLSARLLKKSILP